VDSSEGSRELLPGHEGVAGGMSRGNGPGGPYVPQRRFKDRGLLVPCNMYSYIRISSCIYNALLQNHHTSTAA